MSYIRSTIFLFLLICSCHASLATDHQFVFFEGRVAGIENIEENSTGNDSPRFDYVGGLKGVKIIISSKQGTKETYTGLDGDFRLELADRAVYLVQFVKTGYESSYIVINTKKIPQKYFCGVNTFTGAEFVLLKGGSNESKQKIGTYFYDTKKRNFDFIPNKDATESFSITNNIYLAKKAATINYGAFVVGLAPVVEKPKKEVPVKDSVEPEPDPYDSLRNVNIKSAKAILHDLKKVESILLTGESLTLEEIGEYSILISELKEKILEQKNAEHGKVPSMLIANLEAEIRFIEAQLLKSKQLLALKEVEISQSKKIIRLGAVLGAVLLLGLLYVAYSLIQRMKYSKNLELKNEEISAKSRRINNSLSYSSSVQSATFKSKEKFNALFKHNLLFFRPKDVVSGDFYWFDEVAGNKIIIVGDCTGHGVPGALLTMLGNSFLNEIVISNKIVEPKQIIELLGQKLLSTFEGSNDKIGIYGMDISILSVNLKENKVKYSGAMNGMYQISDGKLEEYKPSLVSLGSINNLSHSKDELKQTEITYKPGDYFFLYSDGFTDQFGGSNREKLNKSRFEKLIQTVSGNFENGGSIMESYFDEWKGTNSQIDDVLVLAVKV